MCVSEHHHWQSLVVTALRRKGQLLDGARRCFCSSSSSLSASCGRRGFFALSPTLRRLWPIAMVIGNIWSWRAVCQQKHRAISRDLQIWVNAVGGLSVYM